MNINKIINNLTYFEDYCKKCKKEVHCCIFEEKSGFAFVGIDDAKKISKKIKKEFDYFLDYSPFPKNIINQLKKEDPSLEGLLRYKELDKQNRILRLKTKKHGRCIFLDDTGKCEIYKIRPNICRIYPYWAIKLDNKEIKIVPHDEDSGCGVIKSKFKINKNLDKTLLLKEKKEIEETFNKIIEEDIEYRINITKFVKNKRLNIDNKDITNKKTNKDNKTK